MNAGKTALISALLLLAAYGMGCSFLGSNEAALLRIQTDRDYYRLISADTIRVTITNTSNRTVYSHTGCGGTALEVLDGNRVVGGIPAYFCLTGGFRELNPGEQVNGNVRLSWIQLHADEIKLSEDLEYRLVYYFYQDKELDHLLDEEELRSNRFHLVTQ